MLRYNRYGIKHCYDGGNPMEISKKDLLKETGISYGQLYRWKREGLIPEEWFMKKSSFTGQETFFPREPILKRIAAIQSLKDRYSLEDMAKFLTPEITNRCFYEDDLELFEEIDLDVVTTFMDVMNKDNFTFAEVVVMIAMSKWQKNKILSKADMLELITHQAILLYPIVDVGYILYLLRYNDVYATLFMNVKHVSLKDTAMMFDNRIIIVDSISLEDISNSIKVKYKDTFQFTFDEEVAL